jgi:hypothetical protein
MSHSSTERFDRGGEPGRDASQAPGGDVRHGEDLPPLPEDCVQELDARPAKPKTFKPAGRSKDSIEGLLQSLVGRPVTVVDPESFEEAAVGYRIRAAIYRAELTAVGEDYAVLTGKFVHRGAGVHNGGAKEGIRHYVPLGMIKRISILAKEPIIHL